MFGMGFFEICMVVIIAIIFLGPDKLPQAMVDLAKFFKALKRTLDDAKNSLDQELNLAELKKEALEYKNSLTQDLNSLNQDLPITPFEFETNPINPSSKTKNEKDLEDKVHSQPLAESAQNSIKPSTQSNQESTSQTSKEQEFSPKINSQDEPLSDRIETLPTDQTPKREIPLSNQDQNISYKSKDS